MNKHNIAVALVEPEIPQNTGNIGRTCVAMGVRLHLVEPLGYLLEDKYLKRAGLDYWPHLDFTVHSDLDTFLKTMRRRRLVLTRSGGGVNLYDFKFEPGDVLVLGRESVGLPDELFDSMPENIITIPMFGPTRSLNLANSTAIVLYEAYRQLGFLKDGWW